jgi:hypothetical protein
VSGLAVEIEITYPGGGEAENAVDNLEAEDFEAEITALGGTSSGFQNFLGVGTIVAPQIVTLSPTPAPALAPAPTVDDDDGGLGLFVVAGVAAAVGLATAAVIVGLVSKNRGQGAVTGKTDVQMTNMYSNPMRKGGM